MTYSSILLAIICLGIEIVKSVGNVGNFDRTFVMSEFIRYIGKIWILNLKFDKKEYIFKIYIYLNHFNYF